MQFVSVSLVLFRKIGMSRVIQMFPGYWLDLLLFSKFLQKCWGKIPWRKTTASGVLFLKLEVWYMASSMTQHHKVSWIYWTKCCIIFLKTCNKVLSYILCLYIYTYIFRVLPELITRFQGRHEKIWKWTQEFTRILLALLEFDELLLSLIMNVVA